jgi:hypothetical protein
MNPMIRGAGALAILVLVGASAGAQTRPTTGLPAQVLAPTQLKPLIVPERTVVLEDLIPADPLQLWHEQLQREKSSLQLNAEQQPAFDSFARELEDVQRMNAQRVKRVMRRVPPVTTAMVDVERDLRTEAGDATDWASALKDLSQRWSTLQKTLSPEQRARMDRIYQRSQLPP